MASAPHASDWSRFPHGADVGVRGRGGSMAEAFENAARAMVDAVVPLDLIELDDIRTVTCEASDSEILLVDWLNAVIYAMAAENMIFGDFRVRIDGGRLAGEMRGEKVDRARHEPAVELKGATLTELEVAQGADGRWVGQCVVDV